MGAKISLGWVSTNINISNEYNILINNLKLLGVKINCVKFSSDNSGFHWSEIEDYRTYSNKKLLSILKELRFLEISISNFPFGKLTIDAVIKLEVTNKYFGFLLEMEESSIISSYKIKELETAEDLIIQYLNLIFKNFNVDYAFSDQEAEVEFSPEEYKQLERPYYAIEARRGHDGKVKITKANWYINGLTQRL
ncbi:hypothetical protein HNO89_002198 [Sporosarcina luteola]|nr:hypothetical protein [Sporosarcina luteola]